MHIISGTLKGRRIQSSAIQEKNTNLRPTTNYSKQVLFNLLNNNKTVNFNFKEKTVLDAFCGTGAVGFEFLSRGAKSACFIDSNRENINMIIKNSRLLNIPSQTKLLELPAIKFKDIFDIIFLDPPYMELAGKTVKIIQIFMEQNLSQDGIIICEISVDPDFREKFNYELEKKDLLKNIILDYKTSGKTTFLFFKKI